MGKRKFSNICCYATKEILAVAAVFFRVIQWQITQWVSSQKF